jgi:hypothetical protein
MTIDRNLENPPRRHRPSFGRPRSERGPLDLFDTPPKALYPLLHHEPLLAGVTDICEPCCGLGNLVYAMRGRGIVVHASDVLDRGCPDSTTLDFFDMKAPPGHCRVLLTNPPFRASMDMIEHALAIGFDVVIVLAKVGFLNTLDRFHRLHAPGHLRRVFPLAERLQDMHDANFTGERASQSQLHAWLTIDRHYRGAATVVPISIGAPAAHMPWGITS